MSHQNDIQGEGLPGNIASDPSTSLCPGLLGAKWGGDKGMEEVKYLFPLGFAALLLRNKEISTLL